MNAVKIYPPDYFKTPPVVHKSLHTPFLEHPQNISLLIPVKPTPDPTIHFDQHIIKKIRSHRKRGKGVQLLSLKKCEPFQDAM